MKFSDKWHLEELERYEAHLQEDDEAEMQRYGYQRDWWASFDSSFPQMSRHSLLVYVYACFENSLNDFCDSVKLVFNLDVDFRDIENDKGIRRAKTYVTKNTNIEFPSQSKDWQKICFIGKVRNKLVHTFGRLEEELDRKIMRYIVKTEGISIAKNAEKVIEIESGYVLEVISTIENFQNQLLKNYAVSGT